MGCARTIYDEDKIDSRTEASEELNETLAPCAGRRLWIAAFSEADPNMAVTEPAGSGVPTISAGDEAKTAKPGSHDQV